jgi:glucosamine-6-phosphate deaminase
VRVIIENTADDAAVRAAWFVADLIRRRPACVLGLVASRTLQGTYRELIRLHRETGLDFAQVTVFALHEYLGMGEEHSHSCGGFLRENFLRHVNFDPARTYLLDGCLRDFDADCQRYEQRIREAGGIDLQILGISRDGQLALHEPGASLGGRTRVRTLTGETFRDSVPFPGGPQETPRLAITLGVGTILESRRCLLLATGAAKAAAVRSLVEGPITAQVTASALQLHQDVIAVLDEEAGSWLTRREAYAEREQAQQLLEAGQFNERGMGKR